MNQLERNEEVTDEGDGPMGFYSFYWDCGRQGCVEGVFITRTKYVDKAIGKNVYFGEILGKHSDVYGTLDKGDLTLKTDDQDFIQTYLRIVNGFKRPVGNTDFINYTISGYNPLVAISEEEDEV